MSGLRGRLLTHTFVDEILPGMAGVDAGLWPTAVATANPLVRMIIKLIIVLPWRAERSSRRRRRASTWASRWTST